MDKQLITALQNEFNQLSNDINYGEFTTIKPIEFGGLKMCIEQKGKLQ